MFKVKFMRWVVNVVGWAYWRKQLPAVAKITDKTVSVDGGAITVRVYTPEGTGPFPAIVYYHGGGFVIGGIKNYEGMCRDLCVKSGSVVISVDYRLAPEHPCPTAVYDAYAAVKWVNDNRHQLGLNDDKLVVAGDSAGGNLATLVSIMARDEHLPLIKGQVLLYPVTHHYDYGTKSYEEKARGYGLTKGMMVWFWDSYQKNSTVMPPGTISHALATPLTIENLEGLPPALVITAENDPLRDEGIEYADKLKAQGNDVQHTLYSGEEHGFMGTYGPTDSHCKAMQETVDWIKQL